MEDESHLTLGNFKKKEREKRKKKRMSLAVWGKRKASPFSYLPGRGKEALSATACIVTTCTKVPVKG